MNSFEQEIKTTREWLDSPRFEGTLRLYTARQVVQQRGTIRSDYRVARDAADGFYNRLRELFEQKKSITTFGPYSPGQATAMKRAGIEGIYIGGWATSAKGSTNEDPGSDLASYPLSQVPNEAAVVVRALLAADKNQSYARSQMSREEAKAIPEIDYRPFIIADADTGHGGDPHVRNLIRRFVEVGVPGYHIEDQRPGTKKCGHQGGKVLVASDEQIKRLNAARFQLDVMQVAGIIVARTDAESATLLDGRSDERDQPFILGSTNIDLVTYKVAFLALIKTLHELGMEELNGHLLYSVSDREYERAARWLSRTGIATEVKESVENFRNDPEDTTADRVFHTAASRLADAWHTEAGLKTYGRAVADVMEFRLGEGETFDLAVNEWIAFADQAPYGDAREKARSMGIHIIWDCEHAKTPEGYYQVQGGIDYAIAKSLAAAPFADILWMETKTAKLEDAKKFAGAIRARYPHKMLAYNLSPSFNWDTTGMNDDEMRAFPVELGKLGFVFNFITYGGHQIDGLAGEEFATALQQEGMLALAHLQRKFRLVESPYKTPQTLAGGPRADGALMASSGRTATTKAMGKGSTQQQHLVQTEVPPTLLEKWLGVWADHYDLLAPRVELRPHRAGSGLLELSVVDQEGDKIANVIFAGIKDRNERSILSVRDHNTFDLKHRRKRLMALMHLFLIHRYKIESVHYVSPTDDNQHQSEKMRELGFFTEVNVEVGHIIVGEVDPGGIAQLLEPDGVAIGAFITKASPVSSV